MRPILVVCAAAALMACKTDNGVVPLREPPVATITSPSAGEILEATGVSLALEGQVSDLPDPAATLVVAWFVDDAPLQSFPPNTEGFVTASWPLVDVGEHVIRLDVTDSDDNTTSATVAVELVAPAAPPAVEITAPTDGSVFDFDASITFTGIATDANDRADDLAFSWTSSLDGALTGATSGGGLSFLTTDALTEGDHTIVLSVTDLDGETGTDSIVVTVGAEPPPDPVDPEPGEVIFSELLIDPEAADDTVGEWVELYNTGGRWLDIGGYSFHDLDFDQYTLTGTIRVAPYDYVVLCANLDPDLNGGVTCDAYFERLTSGGLALGNSGDEVVLSRADGTEIDRLEYGDSWDIKGVALGVDPTRLTGTDNDDFANWCAQTSAMPGGDLGTPGAENDPCGL